MLELVSENGSITDEELEQIRGRPAELVCKVCSSPNSISANFCTECGSILAEEPVDHKSGFVIFLETNRDFIRVGIGFLFLLSIRYSDPLMAYFTESQYWSCGFVAGYTIALVTIFISELHGLRRAIRNQVCSSFFREGFLFHIICQRKVWTTAASVIFALLLSCSLAIFMFTAPVSTLAILFVDVVIFVWLSSYIPGYLAKQVAQSAHGILAQLFLIFTNVLTIFLLFVVYWLFETYWLQPGAIEPFSHPDEVAAIVIDQVKHSCWTFRTVARFVYAAGLFIEGLQTAPVFGKWLYPLFYFTSLSLLPFVGVTVVYNFFKRGR